MTMINTTRCHVEDDGTHLEADMETDQGTYTSLRSATLTKWSINRTLFGMEVERCALQSSNRERERCRPVS